MSGYVSPVEVDGITRPCANCDTVNLHFLDHGAGCKLYVPAVMDRPFTPAFTAIMAAAHKLGMPRHYTSDLFRDYQALVCGAFGAVPREFLWAVGDTGTHEVWEPVREDRYGTPAAVALARSIVRIWPDLHWYWWDGARLHETAQPVAIAEDIHRRKRNREDMERAA